MKLEFPMFLQLWEESNSVFPSLFYYLVLNSPLKSEQTQVPKPLLVRHVLQPPTPPLGSLQYASFSLTLGHPKLDPVFPMWSHRGWLEQSHHLPQLDGYSLANAAQHVVGLFCCMGSLVTWFQESWVPQKPVPLQHRYTPICFRLSPLETLAIQCVLSKEIRAERAKGFSVRTVRQADHSHQTAEMIRY